jgi:FkbM family methyltransferase
MSVVAQKLLNARKYLNILGVRGLLSGVRAKATHSTHQFELVCADCRHPIRLRLPSTDLGAYEQVFLDGQYDFSVKTPPNVIVDAGANIGLASIYFANRYPQAQVFAIEPEQSNFELLKVNVAPYPNVVPIQAALWNRNEELNLFDPGLGEYGFMTDKKDASERLGVAGHVVEGVTVDKIMADYGLSWIDILKVDIEGAEREVFSDTSAWIGNVNSVIIELHERMKVGCNRSFYRGSVGFDHEWQQGEKVYLSRGDYLTPRVALPSP